MNASGLLALAAVAALASPSAALGAEVSPAAPRTTDAPLLPAQALLPGNSGFFEDPGALALRRAALDLGWAETPALRFGATRFTAEGPWGDFSFRRDDGRVLRFWLTDTGEPEPLIASRRARRDFSLRWSLSGAPRSR